MIAPQIQTMQTDDNSQMLARDLSIQFPAEDSTPEISCDDKKLICTHTQAT